MYNIFCFNLSYSQFSMNKNSNFWSKLFTFDFWKSGLIWHLRPSTNWILKTCTAKLITFPYMFFCFPRPISDKMTASDKDTTYISYKKRPHLNPFRYSRGLLTYLMVILDQLEYFSYKSMITKYRYLLNCSVQF